MLTPLLAVGFGRTSPALLDASAIGAAQAAFSVLVVAHVAIAGYGGFLVATSGSADESPPLWAAKLALTGVGGLNELRGTLAASRRS